ncbi:S-layer homology domain-containing protein [Sedimentibacter sp. MB35-C1]|uniref:S-layer homology domain-containing protein n=1 Tax=Sedimentibacter sp. MB35-C1 TaxID=3070995 RepID=UPI0027DF8B96|nr:S-layer homology domain-containing protein [Sedimentibacter sp. MB35-C1]WMJ77506.1 S-layer homology domain-containing protein [Sedimentibacter sp. MB35-C1]
MGQRSNKKESWIASCGSIINIEFLCQNLLHKDDKEENMQKRILSILLTVCMIMAMLPVMALAEDYQDWTAAMAEDVTLTADTDTITIDGVSYTYKGDVSNAGLDLSSSTPTETTAYIAEDGYILWGPTVDTDSNVTGGTLTLNGASISVTSGTALKLPNVEITIDVEGENTISGGSYGIYKNIGTTTIEGSGTLTVSHIEYGAICLNNDLLIITGDVTVVANSAGPIAAYGQNPQDGLTISGNANVMASGGGEQNIYSNGTITINTTGEVNAPNIRTTADFTYTSGTMTGSLVLEGKDNYYENFVYSVYGDFALTTDQTINSCSGEDGLTVLTGATLTIDEGVTLTIEDGAEITNNGTIINNGTINFMDESITAETINNLNLSGCGKIQIDSNNVLLIGGEFNTVYSDISNDKLDLNTDTPTEKRFYTAGDGYVLWEPTLDDSSVVTSGTLTLHNATINNTSGGALYLPNLPVTIEVEGENNITSSSTGIFHDSGDTDIQGSGILNVTSNGSSSDGICQGNDTLTITGDVTVASATGNMSYGINAQKALTISGNANVTVSGVSRGIYSNGSITVNTIGTVNAQRISTGYFSYQSGNLTGSWVSEGKENYYNNLVQTVYGSYELTDDKTITAWTDEDGLTVAYGGTLTIDDGVTITVEDGTEITNNGTIVNNGTINFQGETISAATITALNLTGDGSVQVNGTPVLVVDGKFYSPNIEISNSTLDLSTGAPTTDTVYIAGNGYVLWKPTVESEAVTAGTLTLHNATMEANEYKALITLPTVDVIVELEGENSLTNNVDANDIIAIIKQGGIAVIDKDNPVKQVPQDYKLTFLGDGTLETETNSKIPISTDGTLIIASSGNIDTENIYAVNFVMDSGYLKGNLYSSGDTVINGGTIYNEKAGICQGDFSMTGGTANYHSLDSYGLVCIGTVTYTGGTLNASVLTVDAANFIITNTIYGDCALSNETMQTGISQYSAKYILRISSGSRWTIDSDSKMYTAGNASGLVMSGVTADNIGEYIINNGTLVNNGIILLPNGLTEVQVKTIAQNVLKASGTGKIQVYDGVDGTNNTIYSNSGERITVIHGDLDLARGDHSSATLADDGYTWTGNSTDGYTLTLGGAYVDGNLTLPDNSPVKIHTTADSVINGVIQGAGSYLIDFTFTGTAELSINGDIVGFTNGDTITVQDGAQLTINGLISIGASGTDGTLVVTGEGTTMSIPSTGAYAIGCDTVRVEGGATLNVSAEYYSIHTLDGGISVTDGSTLTVGCDYGVYIEDGTFTVDDSSIFTADAAVAAICVVDKSTTKSQSETLNVSSTLLPSGTEIASAIGDRSGYGYTYWSIVTSGNILSATDENYTPVTLSNAVGELTLKKNSSSGGSSSTTSYTITATAGENGSISANGKVNVVKNSDKSFTITPDSGYVVSDVLVDGVSVGAVTSYIFENVAKNHTITASFVKSVEQPETITYDDVKDSDWFKDAVYYVTNEGLMSGMGNDEFGPYINTDRGMIVTILWRLEGQPEASSDASFSDVTEGKYYEDAVNWGVENDIVKGYGNGNFGPTDTITREQMAAILYRYSQFKGYDTTQGGMAVQKFSDYDMISDWALESVTWSVNAKLMSGKDNNVIDARGEATRAEVATILMHFCQNVSR